MNPNDYGYETMDEMVRDHWKRYGSCIEWPAKWPRLKVPARHKKYPLMQPTLADDEAVPVPNIDCIAFRVEKGTVDGVPSVALMSGDVIIEHHPLKAINAKQPRPPRRRPGLNL